MAFQYTKITLNDSKKTEIIIYIKKVERMIKLKETERANNNENLLSMSLTKEKVLRDSGNN